VFVSFFTIVTNDNEPLAQAQDHIHVAAHINEASSTFNWFSLSLGHIHIRGCSITATRAVCISRVYYLLYYTIVTNDNEPLAAAQAHIHVATHINEASSTLNWPSPGHI